MLAGRYALSLLQQQRPIPLHPPTWHRCCFDGLHSSSISCTPAPTRVLILWLLSTMRLCLFGLPAGTRESDFSKICMPLEQQCSIHLHPPTCCYNGCPTLELVFGFLYCFCSFDLPPYRHHYGPQHTLRHDHCAEHPTMNAATNVLTVQMDCSLESHGVSKFFYVLGTQQTRRVPSRQTQNMWSRCPLSIQV